jgi:hypothetical protein
MPPSGEVVVPDWSLSHLDDWSDWRIDYVQTRATRKTGSGECAGGAARTQTRMSVLTFERTRLHFVQQLGCRH